MRAQQTLIGADLAGWIADCGAAAVRLQLDHSHVCPHGCDELDVNDSDDEFEDACFVLSIMTPSGHGASHHSTLLECA